MIRITCHNDNVHERKYAIDILFHTLLEMDNDAYDVVFEDTETSYVIEFNGHNVIIEDHFFRKFSEPLSYFNIRNIPTELKFFHTQEKDIPIIYGIDKFEKKGRTTTIGLDIFASTFFMLTRWEEFLLGREEKGDCDEKLLFAVKNNIYMHPIVHEYEDLLRELLGYGGISCEKKRKYHIVLSHDVDGFITPSWKRIVKDIWPQTIHGAPKNKVLNLTWKEKIKYKFAFPTAYCQFEKYTALSEKNNIQEWFYFKVCDKGEKEVTYIYKDKLTKEIVEKLKEKKNPNIIIGFHPSQNILGRKKQWDKEVSRITALLHEKPNIGRNHHLLYNSETLRWWEKITEEPLNISNCVFHRRQGFRSGICIPYPVFDLFQRRMMNLIEHPCQIMDTIIRYDENTKSNDERSNDIQNVIEKVKNCQGELVLTWHIYIRNKKIIQDYYYWCEKVINYAV